MLNTTDTNVNLLIDDAEPDLKHLAPDKGIRVMDVILKQIKISSI